MKKLKTLLLGAYLICMPFFAYGQSQAGHGVATQVALSLQYVNPAAVNSPFHRLPLSLPNVFLDNSIGILYFEEPCYDCTLELVIPGTETTVYDAVIEDGADVLQLPDELHGTYELHIHRGNFCFFGDIEL